MLINFHRWRRRMLATPPRFSLPFTMDSYRDFMEEETFSYSPRYAKQRVVVHGAHTLNAITDGGALIAFLHYGSFFLMGGAIRHQLGLPFTLIASRRNLNHLSPQSMAFWQGAHNRSGEMYEKNLFFSDEPVIQLIRWLEKPKHILGVALDVHEIGYPKPRFPFEFLGRQVFLPIEPARLAKLAKVAMVPAIMQFDTKLGIHHLRFFSSIQVDSPTLATQKALSALEGWVEDNPSQQYFDIALAFQHQVSP